MTVGNPLCVIPFRLKLLIDLCSQEGKMKLVVGGVALMMMWVGCTHFSLWNMNKGRKRGDDMEEFVRVAEMTLEP